MHVSPYLRRRLRTLEEARQEVAQRLAEQQKPAGKAGGGRPKPDGTKT